MALKESNAIGDAEDDDDDSDDVVDDKDDDDDDDDLRGGGGGGGGGGESVYGALTLTIPAESLLTSFFVHHIIPNVLIVSIIIPVITIIGI